MHTDDVAPQHLPKSASSAACSFTRECVFNGTEKMKSAEQFISFGQGNVEAMVKSSQIVATGLQDLGKQIAANAQAAIDESMSTFRAMTSVRSIKEAFEMQANFARASVEKAMSQTGQFTEASMKLAGEAYEPIAGRVSVAVQSFRAS
ncbi:MAG: phasin family protein [Pseudomonadota bacterium]|nr:phasin family protein [Pseudomonadota bacterium]